MNDPDRDDLADELARVLDWLTGSEAQEIAEAVVRAGWAPERTATQTATADENISRSTLEEMGIFLIGK